MRTLFIAATDAKLVTYRTQLTGEKLGWFVYQSAACYAPVHQVLVDPLEGPVIVAGHEVLALDDDAEVFATEEAAREAYWQRVQEAAAVVAKAGEIRPENV